MSNRETIRRVLEEKNWRPGEIETMDSFSIDMVEIIMDHVRQTTMKCSEDTRMSIAKVIDPVAFDIRESLYRYCLAHGDVEEEAAACADKFHGTALTDSYRKADEIIALLGLKVRAR